ncbi:MAG: FmdB family transcriptional regulator [Candidatus Riflebacteria bacterium]|nr:FmdB family transcriptional regulator [Candidatus Riflebacteria bacterium]
MPTYGYLCNSCGNKFESFHSMKCTDIQHCPTCGGEGKKLLSATSIIFKGSGFYSTDYRDSGYVEAAKKDTSSSSSATGTPAATPAAATPAKTPTETKSASSTSKTESAATPSVPVSSASASTPTAAAA